MEQRIRPDVGRRRASPHQDHRKQSQEADHRLQAERIATQMPQHEPPRALLTSTTHGVHTGARAPLHPPRLVEAGGGGGAAGGQHCAPIGTSTKPQRSAIGRRLVRARAGEAGRAAGATVLIVYLTKPLRPLVPRMERARDGRKDPSANYNNTYGSFPCTSLGSWPGTSRGD